MLASVFEGREAFRVLTRCADRKNDSPEPVKTLIFWFFCIKAKERTKSPYRAVGNRY